MRTVRVERYCYHFLDGTKWEEKGFNKGSDYNLLPEGHPLYELFPVGTLKINIKVNPKGNYKFMSRGSTLLTFLNKRNEDVIVCKSFAQGALGRNKRFRKGFRYSLTVKEVIPNGRNS